MKLDPKIWIEHYKFTMITISMYYPKFPNDVTKKKYYDFIQNIPLFIPQKPLGDEFIKILDEFPVTPYLDSRLSFMKWVNFINNKLNKRLGIEETDLYKSLEQYYAYYKPEEILIKEKREINFKYIQFSIIALLMGGGIYLYTK
jgi:hypothetical protein